MATDEELAARFGERFDAATAEAMVSLSGADSGIPAYLGMRFTGVGPGWCTCEVEVTDELLNPFGAAHGAVVASLVDHVLGSSVFPLVPRGTWPASLEFKVNYLAPVRPGPLEARAEVASISSRTAVVEIACTNGGRKVATALGTVALVPPKG